VVTLIGGAFTSLPNNAIETVKNGEKLNVKFGIDPTRDRLHLGHFVPLRLLKHLKSRGHKIHLILGTFTAQLGDPSGRDKTRPILSKKVVEKNAEKILEQVCRITGLDVSVHRNHQFMQDIDAGFFVSNIVSQFTVAKMLSRDAFRKRGNNGISLHELMVPLIQGWDSVMIEADVEVGGTDQLFNFQISRELQEKDGQNPQVCLMTPVINGTDGRKMSKSFNNCIFLDEPPEEIFGKVMSISDEVMDQWNPLLSSEICFLSNPMEKKKRLAGDIVKQIHGQDSADKAALHFESKIQKGMPEDVTEVKIGPIIPIIQQIRNCSKSEARRLIKGGAIRVDGIQIKNENVVMGPGSIIKMGKRHWAKIEEQT